MGLERQILESNADELSGFGERQAQPQQWQAELCRINPLCSVGVQQSFCLETAHVGVSFILWLEAII